MEASPKGVGNVERPDTHLSSQQYRKLAEGLLQTAIGAANEQKQDLIGDALRYLKHATALEERQSEAETLAEVEDQDDSRCRQVRQLIRQALEAPTPNVFADHLDFATKFRRLSVWNAYMARIQRPGARIIATKREWEKIGHYVLPDAVPIMILWPFSPIRLVYELEDTGPPIGRDAMADPFAVRGKFQTAFLSRLASSLKKQKTFTITLEGRRHGSNRAGSAAAQGNLWNLQNEEIGRFAGQHASSDSIGTRARVPSFRVTVNDRLQPAERFVTIAHELAHIFCGHLGGCTANTGNEDESGWPDRRDLGTHEKEIEAEAAAFLVAARAGLVANSARYLAGHARNADMKQVSLELVIRAAARIERLAKVRYGKMAF